jgi:hypothetical protein
MNKKPAPITTCRSCREGEKRGLALGVMAGGRRGAGKKHGSEHRAKLTNKPPHQCQRTDFMH